MYSVTYRPDPQRGLWTGAAGDAAYRGLYINLDRSADRRAAIEAQLKQFNLGERYARLPATDAAALPKSAHGLSGGEDACFHSHHRALDQARERGVTVHVMEDDAVLSRHTEPAIVALEQQGAFAAFDVVLAETFLFPDAMALRQFKQWFDAALAVTPPRFSVQDFTPYFSCTSASYVVGASSLDRVAAAFRRGVEEGPKLPFDLFIREEAKQGRLRLGCIFPFITSTQFGEANQTTIPGRGAESAARTIEVLNLLRYSFFVDRDLGGAAKPMLDRLQAGSDRDRNDPHRRLIGDALGFVASSDNFSMF